MTELEALVILGSIPFVGSIKARQLIYTYGSASASLEIEKAEIQELPGFGPKIADSWGNWKKDRRWRRNLDLVHSEKVTLIPYSDPSYPKKLLEISDHPLLLYVQGTLKPIDQKGIAVVGTRQASIYGLELAEHISGDLASRDYTIISGLARGIDTAAHKGALSQGRTLAVIGSGLADIYPKENMRLAEEIAENGAVISEFPMETPPDRQNFPQRNRIVSGMSMGVVLIEAPLKSGAMITMEKAKDQQRQLFALPGRVDNPNYAGNHALIKGGHAQLIENAADIAAYYGDLFGGQLINKKATPQVVLDKDEEDLLNKLPSNEINIEELVVLTKLPIKKINILLMSLLLKKAIKEFPGKVYKKALCAR